MFEHKSIFFCFVFSAFIPVLDSLELIKVVYYPYVDPYGGFSVMYGIVIE